MLHTGLLWRIADMKSGRVCVRGTGIMAQMLAGRFSAGESIAELSHDYDLSAGEVEAAIRCVVASAFGSRGLLAPIVRKMEARIPLEPARQKKR